MIDRIRKLIASEQMNPSQFADEIEFNRSSLSHVLSGRNKPSLDFVIKIKQRFTDVNLDWILFGKGDMQLREKGEIAFEAANKSIDVGLDDIGTNFSRDSEEQAEYIKKSAATRRHAQNIKDFEVKIASGIAQRVIIFFNDGTFEEYSSRKA